MSKRFLNILAILIVMSLLAACGGQKAASPSGTNNGNAPVKLTLAAYSTPSEAYGKIIPLFVNQWKTQNN